MIKSIKTKSLKLFWNKNDSSKLTAKSVDRIDEVLDVLDNAGELRDFKLPSYEFHSLKGFNPKRYSIKVDENFRITFEFEDGDVFNIKLEDYH